LRSEFSEISSDEWNSIFLSHQKKKTTLRAIRKFSKISYPEFPLHLIFIPDFPKFSFEWFAFLEIQQFPDFFETFSGNFRTIVPVPTFSQFLFEWKAPVRFFFKLNQLEMGLGLKTLSIRFICMVCVNAVQSNLLKVTALEELQNAVYLSVT